MAVDPFFASTRKRKRSNNKATKKGSVKPQPKNTKPDSDIEDNEEDNFDTDLSAESEVESSEEEIEETAAEKRVRLAKAYLGSIEKSLEDDITAFDAADLDRDLIAERLKKDDDENEGRLHLRIADTFKLDDVENIKMNTMRGHQLPVTAVALSEDGAILYSASKDGSIVKWDAKTFKKLHTFLGGRKGVKNFDGHTQAILCLAISYDGQYLASGGQDKVINIWSVKENKHIVKFTQHRDTVSGLAFRKGSNQLYSASHDRTIKLWNIDERAYIETLFGHQDQITDIDTLGRERCVSTGGRDKTARWWKIPEESQLIYRGSVSTKNSDGSNRPLYVEGSLDCIAQIDESMFITGGDSGVISLWDINRKKPVFSQSIAHGLNIYASESEGDIKTPYWITALASLKYSDLFVSGSWDGYVRIWKLASDNKSFSQIGQIPVQGVINSIQIKTSFPSKRTLLVLGIGQELKLGRWLRLKNGVKNCTKVIELETKPNELRII
ncbi:WD40-repeat-containing domain protein [Cokeromyces recurvatus]|uniref:WD40-repeat-containing domain protein n=1 Tax=Cokeromyces recurvatus TaxID=90255 RepID=UPI00221FF42B|nr:WD40-repeat-containing domain protein [Cokeromyces recurvatus]KAI7906516.1 WD40-repeat-containing domain protein [Cokeromyces recurvatus]